MRKKSCYFFLGWLIFLTVFASLPGNVIGPFDARTLKIVKGFHFEFSNWGAIIEPFASLSNIIGYAPFPHIAVISTFIWIIVISIGLISKM